MKNYTIASINNNYNDNSLKTKNILKNFNHIKDIEFFNGIDCDGKKRLKEIGINVNKWMPYDGRKLDPLPGEYGAMITKINTLKYIIDNSLDNMLFLEDDIILDNNFYKKFFLCLKELPKNFDFLSLYYIDDQNYITSESDIKLRYIHRSINQYAGTQIMYYSKNGAKKILELLYKKGMEYTADCFIFKQCHLGLLNGYSIKPETLVMGYQNTLFGSVIDPKNLRVVR